MRVLYVNHTGLVSGGERSLLGLLESLPADVEPRLAGPPGPLHEYAARIGTRTATVAGTAGSLKLHPVHTPVALAAMAATAGGVLRAAHSWQADVLHANSIRAGIIADPVARALKRPLVVHVRDCLPPSLLTKRLQASLAVRAGAVIAISNHVARSFDPDGIAPRLRIIYNPFDLAKLDPARIDRAEARNKLGVADDEKVLALVGQITPWKGQEEAIRADAASARSRRSGCCTQRSATWSPPAGVGTPPRTGCRSARRTWPARCCRSPRSSSTRCAGWGCAWRTTRPRTTTTAGG